MYSISPEYNTAVKNSSRITHIRGTVGGQIFSEENILYGSFSITNQCSENSELSIGSVYVGELKCTFVNVNISRYGWQGLNITPYFSIEGASDSVPLGIYTIVEANWTQSGVEVTAYDYMAKFDKSRLRWPPSDTLLGYVKLVCGLCSVVFGMTDAEFEALPNGTGTFELAEANDIENYRDMLSWIAQTTATFATIDRQGRLVFRAYNQTVVDTLDNYDRFKGAKFSDYTTRYTGMSVVDVDNKKTMYYHVNPDDALVMNLGTNPFMQFGNEAARAVIRNNVLNAIASGINYVPMEVSMAGNPAYDLGDVLAFTGGIADSTKKCCITKFDWTYGGAYKVTGAGQNPALASAKSKSDKNLEGLMSETEYIENLVKETEKNYFDFESSTAITVADGGIRQEVALVQYDAGSMTRCEFRAEIQLDVSTTETSTSTAYGESDALIKVTYQDNGTDITEYYPLENAFDGKKLLHLLYVWEAPVLPSTGRIFKAYMQSNGAALTVSHVQAYVSTFGGVVYEPNPVSYIYVEDEPEWEVYPGSQLDYSGVVIAAVHEDGSEVDVTAFCTFSPAEGTVTTETDYQHVDVTYTDEDGTYTTDFDIPISEPYVTGIEVIHLPNKTAYEDGERLNYTGLQVVANYNNGTQVDITSECEFDPEDNTYVELTADHKTTVYVSWWE